MTNLLGYVKKLLAAVHIPNYIKITDIVEILIIAFLVYQILKWIKTTRAWALLRGVFVIFIFIGIAAIFNMTTIIWIAKNVLSIAIIAFIIVMQPELRKALEQLGSKGFLSNLFPFETVRHGSERYSEKTMNEIVRACFDMGRVRTGALIVMEQKVSLLDYDATGIPVDALVTHELLINTFEKNTPLHDGAVIMRNDRLTSATCYLPLSSSSDLSKELGTRHRAAVGISEVTDALTIVVSEETGGVSVAYLGQLYRNLTPDGLREKINILRELPEDNKSKKKIALKWGKK